MKQQGIARRGKTACPLCPSSDAFQIYDNPGGRVSGFCFSCEKAIYNLDSFDIKNNNKMDYNYNSIKKDINWVLQNSSIQEIPDRKITKAMAEMYGIRVSVDPSTREITHHYYPYFKGDNLVAFKERAVGSKEFTIIGNGKELPFFGQNLVGSKGKLLIVTEGELDAVSASQMLRDRGKSYRVVSLPHGANDRGARDNIEWLNTFENIFLALDQDKNGIEASIRIADLLPPGKVKTMTFSEKDASDMLLSGKSAEFFNSVYNAKSYRPDGIVGVDDVIEEALKPVEWGLSWPWPTLTKATYGYRRKEIYGFGAGSGAGKTEGFKEIIDHVINVHQLSAGVIFLEESVAKTLKVLAGKKFNKRFHIPDGDWTIEELTSGINDLRGKVYLYNHYGSKDWENIKAKIRYMVLALGIKDIFLDHLTALVAQESDEYKALNRIMEEMSSLTQELDCTIFYISHLRKANGTPHEEGGHVSADQFKGSGAIVFWSNFLFGYERNQQAPTFAERNTTTFRVLKDRNTGLSTGLTFLLWYDHVTGRWREKTDEDGVIEDIYEE